MQSLCPVIKRQSRKFSSLNITNYRPKPKNLALWIAWRWWNFSLSVQLDISGVSAANSWDIELKTRREIPYLYAPIHFSLLIPCTYLLFGQITCKNLPPLQGFSRDCKKITMLKQLQGQSQVPANYHPANSQLWTCLLYTSPSPRDA